MRVSIESLPSMLGGLVVLPSTEPLLVTGLSWDSREINPGDAYLALVGARVDGHEFAISALEAGASCLIVSHDLDPATYARVKTAGKAVIRVDDGQAALIRLAAAWRTKLNARVIAITGSSGKTTTKNLLAGVLGRAMRVVATASNQNNELGVPRTLLRADPDTEALIVEMGMRGETQISELCSFVKPDMGLVTNVGTSHIELLGSREAIARAKSELIACLPRDRGWAFMGANNPHQAFMLSHAQARARGIHLGFFGREPLRLSSEWPPDLLVSARAITLDGKGRPHFELVACDKQLSVELELAGLHNLDNALAVIAVALVCGMDLCEVLEALRDAKPVAGRQRRLQLAGDVVLIDDAYNANPDSMEASLRTFAALDIPSRHIALLGDMGELGAYACEAHRDMGRLVAELGIDELACVGELAQLIAASANDAGMAKDHIWELADAKEALQWARATLRPGDGMLVKASHAMALDRVVEGLMVDA